MLGGPGFPYGTVNDPHAAHELFPYGLSQAQGAPWVACLGLVGAAIGLLAAQVRSKSASAVVLITLAWTQAVVYALIIPDGRLLVAAAHLRAVRTAADTVTVK